MLKKMLGEGVLNVGANTQNVGNLWKSHLFNTQHMDIKWVERLMGWNNNRHAQTHKRTNAHKHTDTHTNTHTHIHKHKHTQTCIHTHTHQGGKITRNLGTRFPRNLKVSHKILIVKPTHLS